MPQLPGFCSPSGAVRSAAVDASRSINLYLEEVPNQRGAYVLYGMPGLRPWLQLPSAPVRGLYETTTARTFAVTSTSLYELFSGGTFLARGTVHTGTAPVFLTDNGTHLVLSVDGLGYSYALATDTLTALPLTGPQTFGRVAYLDQRILTNEPGTSRFWYSELGDATTWPPLNFYAVEGRADPLVTLFVDHREIFLPGTQTMEMWVPTGDALAPYARSSSVFIEQGIAAPASVVAANNTFYFLGGSARGQGPIWRLEGYTPRRVSTSAVETAMGTMPTVGDAVAFSASWGGHSWVGWYFPTGNQTWLFDTNLESWTELADLEEDGSLHAFRSYTHAYSAGEHVWGSRASGDVYLWDDRWYRYGTDPIYRARITPHVRQDQQPVRYAAFELVMQAGVGLDGGVVPGADPQVMLAWSDDGGEAWSYPLWRSAGPLGRRERRVVWRRLGRAPTTGAFKVAMTDPVPTAWLGASVEVASG